jgi:hypothetical protein
MIVLLRVPSSCSFLMTVGYGGPAQPSPLLGDALNAGIAISK